MKYLEKARNLHEAGFFVSGYGNFDISVKELAEILELLEKEDFKGIAKLYKLLSKERL